MPLSVETGRNRQLLCKSLAISGGALINFLTNRKDKVRAFEAIQAQLENRGTSR